MARRNTEFTSSLLICPVIHILSALMFKTHNISYNTQSELT